MTTQHEIFQAIFDTLAHSLSENWTKIELTFRINHERRGSTASIEERDSSGKIVETYPMPNPAVSDLVADLRHHLSGDGAREPFTHCKIIYTATGEFKAKYSYQTIDWNNIVDWFDKIDYSDES